MNLPWSIHRRAEVESQEEAIDDRTDVQKLHDACREYLNLVAIRKALIEPCDYVENVAAIKLSSQTLDRAFTRIVEIINEQFGDEVDVELLAKALAS